MCYMYMLFLFFITDVVHLTKEANNESQSPEESLQSVVTKLFKDSDTGDELQFVVMKIQFDLYM